MVIGANRLQKKWAADLRACRPFAYLLDRRLAGLENFSPTEEPYGLTQHDLVGRNGVFANSLACSVVNCIRHSRRCARNSNLSNAACP